jgi:zinc protease
MIIQTTYAVLLILFALTTIARTEAKPASVNALPATVFVTTTGSTPTTEARSGASIQTDSIPNIPYEKYKLKNGLEVILSEDHRLPLVSVNIWYHVGAANELPGRTGFAHLFEHLMFEGSKNVGQRNHHKYLKAAGASENSPSGNTSFDRTSFFETLPSNQIELALWLESDRMGSMLDVLDADKLSTQRDVVRNERRATYENTIFTLMQEGEYHALFPKGHPYFANVMGSHADIESAKLDELRDFSRHYYTPNNATIVIVGDINKEHLKQLVDKYFGSISPGPQIAKVEVLTPLIANRKQVIVTDRIGPSYVLMGWLTPPIYKQGDAEASITAHILGGGNASRLYQELVINKHLALNVNATSRSLALCSIFSVNVIGNHGIKQKQLEAAVNDVLAEFKQNGPTLDEVNNAQKAQKTNIISRLERLGGPTGVSDVLNKYNKFTGDPGYLSQDIDRYNKVTTADAKNFAETYLNSTQSVVVYGVPGKRLIDDVPRTKEKNPSLEKAESSISTPFNSPTEIWRNLPPKPSAASALIISTPAKFKLSNGLTVYVIERHNLPSVALQVVARGGNSINPVKKAGLSLLTVSTLSEGTERRSAAQFARELEQSSVSFNTGSLSDNSWISTYGLTSSITQAFDLLSDAILHPVFAPKEIDKIKKNVQRGMNASSQVAERVLDRQLFGAKQALGYDPRGTNKSRKSISRTDLMDCWQNSYIPGNSALIIAGDVTVARAKIQAEKYFGEWKDAVSSQETQQTGVPAKGTIFIVNQKDALQTAVKIGSIGLQTDSPDYVAANILNNIIGGFGSSRLNMNLRGKHGYTYGASSRFDCYRRTGIFSAFSLVRADATAPAVAEIMSEIERIHNEPISNEEFLNAKNNWSLSLPGDFETAQDAASGASYLFVNDYPVDSYSTLPGRIDATTLDDVELAAKKYLDPKKMVIVTVGDKKKIEPELEKLNLGPLVETDHEGNPW